MRRLKIYPLAPNENWILDRMVNEFVSLAPVGIAANPTEADIIWLVAGNCWNHVPVEMLEAKSVIATVCHIVPSKFNRAAFDARDRHVDAYHVICEKTREQISGFTQKPIHVIPFWVNQHIWYSLRDQQMELREKYGIPNDAFVVGSFQRDTEGHDLVTPKLEKGPDIFCDIIEQLATQRTHSHVCVVLAGWRRQYVMNRLRRVKGVQIVYAELVDQVALNELYNTLDLYIVSARFEGGPQAIVECALTKTPIISTDVGVAGEILAPESIFRDADVFMDATPNTEYAYSSVQRLTIPGCMEEYRKMFERVAHA